MIYEDLLVLWLAYLLWRLSPPLDWNFPFWLKFILFLTKEIFFNFTLLLLRRKVLQWSFSKSLFFERIFTLLAFLFFSLDLLFFDFKKFFAPYYFSDFLIIFWFLHYYFILKLVFYRLHIEYFRILLGLYLPFFIFIWADEIFDLFKIQFPGQIILLLIVIFALSPYLVIKIWPVKRVPEGYLRDLISDFFKRLNLKIRDYLILPRLGAKFYTAGILGFIPPFRYLFFSEGLLELVSPEEVLGILAHEAGHLKKKHGFWLFLLLLTFPLSFLNFVYLFFLLFSLFFETPEEVVSFLKGPYGIYFELSFGLFLFGFSIFFFRVILAYILRSLEREADLYALNLLGDPLPLISALYKIGEITGQLYRKSWHHYGLYERIQYLKYAYQHSQVIKKHSLKLRRILLFWILLNLILISLFTYLGADILEQVLKIFTA